MESYTIDIMIQSPKQLDDSLIDPITFILIGWGLPSELIDWEIYQDKAHLSVAYDNTNDQYMPFSIIYPEFTQMLELLYEYNVILSVNYKNDNEASTVQYCSPYQDTSFTTTQL